MLRAVLRPSKVLSFHMNTSEHRSSHGGLSTLGTRSLAELGASTGLPQSLIGLYRMLPKQVLQFHQPVSAG
jgi:hypothetical protein